jgi:chloride channel 7
MGWMVGLVGIGVILTLLIPSIGGSGLPALIAELNGSKVPNLLTLKTVSGKVCGAIMSVGSGLACGPEGPIIHIGGCIGSLVLTAFQKITGQYMLETDTCDFTSTGSGAGVAAAFKAPLAGTLFVIEEASSFFSIPHLWKTFIASVTAYFTSVAWNNMNRKMDLANEKYEFAVTTGDGCGYKVYQLLYFAFLGVLGGLLGALFNQLVMSLNDWRRKNVNAFAWRRAVEALLIVIFHATMIVVLPKAFECQHSTVGDVINHDVDIKCFDHEILYQFTAGSKTVEQERYQNGYKTDFQSKLVFKTGDNENATIVNSTPTTDDDYTGVNDFEYNKCEEYCKAIVLDIDNLQSYNCKREDEFNELATLLVNYGGNAVKLLFKRGMQDLFHAESLVTACGVYFVMAAVVCGMCIPSGLVVPMLFIGGTFGRLYGLGIHHGWDTDMDPAYTAFVGAAAFMGGSGRILMFLSVVLLEVSNDLELFPSIVIALLLAMWVGNLFNHGLYHCLIDVQGLPYLTATVPGQDENMTLEDIMIKDIHSFTTATTCEEAWQVLLQYDTNNDGKLDPVELVANGAARNYPVVYAEKDGVDKEGKFAGVITIDHLRSDTHGRRESRVGTTLEEIMVKTAVMARPHWYLSYGYALFERLGLRQMVVVDEDARPVGMITRLTLLPWWYEHIHGHDHGGHDDGGAPAVEMKGPKMGSDPGPEIVVTSDHLENSTDGIRLSPRGEGAAKLSQNTEPMQQAKKKGFRGSYDEPAKAEKGVTDI